MKTSYILLLAFIGFLSFSCGSKNNNPEFLNQFSGNYLYTDDELIKVHSENGDLLINWRGAKNIKPLKTADNTFFVKEMNSKIQFLVNPEDNKEYLVLVPKNKQDTIAFVHNKVSDTFKTPSIYLEEGNYKEALAGFLAIKSKDSLSPLLHRRKLNNLGYDLIRKDSVKNAIEVFKINVALHPENDNVYDSLGDAYKRDKDTVNAILNYEKALAIDSGSRHTKRKLEDLRKKETTSN